MQSQISDYEYLSTILQKNSSCFNLNQKLTLYIRPQNRNEKRRKKHSSCSTEDINPKLYDSQIKKKVDLSQSGTSESQVNQKNKIRIAFKPIIRLRNKFLNGNNPNGYSLANYKEIVCNFCLLHIDNQYSKQEDNQSFSIITLEQHQQTHSQTITTQCKHKYHYDCFQNNIKQQLDQQKSIISCICGKKINNKLLKQYTSDVLIRKLLKIQLETIYSKYQESFNLKQCNTCTFFWVKSDTQLYLPICIYCLLSYNTNDTTKSSNLSQITKQKRLRSISMQ
ncbi:unnamed protein product [Paramecium primaurelia]|uniref:RING-type domain-containing protein n=1 Tax=Paramecium primaurelia TaxID=5886 RepID=A0A8S1M8E4_PARPR|nr:unnamed protein product [Paramecium primaurelia]